MSISLYIGGVLTTSRLNTLSDFSTVMMTCISMSCRLYVAIFYNHTILLCIIFFFVHAFYCISVLTLIIKLTEHLVGKEQSIEWLDHAIIFVGWKCCSQFIENNGHINFVGQNSC